MNDKIDVRILNDAKDTFVVSNRVIDSFENHRKLKNGIVINFSRSTDESYHQHEEDEICILGLCVDSKGILQRDQVAEFISGHKGGIEEAYYLTGRFAGKYLIFLSRNGRTYIWGDAISSIPVFFGKRTEDAICVSNTDGLVGSFLDKKVSARSEAMKSAFEGKGTDYLPGNASMYEDVDCLLPNHYLDLQTRTAVRVPLKVPGTSRGEYKRIIRDSIKLAGNILQQYCKYVDFACPLTAGYDSRVVFSFFSRSNRNIECFTFRHRGFSDITPDLAVPYLICRDTDKRYSVFDDKNADRQLVEGILGISGAHYSPISIHNAFTFRTGFSDKAWLNAQIVDQVGKCSHVGTVPYCFAGLTFFKSLHNNYSIEAESEIGKWIDEIRDNGDHRNICDLFEWEIRCGKWASQAIMMYSLSGVDCLNIFNCRDLILKWISIPRYMRVKKEIHKVILSENDDRLLKYPFNPHRLLSKATFYNIIGENSILRLLALLYSVTRRKLIKRG